MWPRRTASGRAAIFSGIRHHGNRLPPQPVISRREEWSNRRRLVVTVLVIAVSIACVPHREVTIRNYSDSLGVQTPVETDISPRFDSMPPFASVQYVETDGTPSSALHYLPESISLPWPDVSGADKWRGFMFIANTGSVDLTRSGVSINGRDSAHFRLVSNHEPALVLPPGEFEDFEVEYRPRHCKSLFNPFAADEAELRIVSTAGVVVVPLIGSRWHCAKKTENTEVNST